MNRLLGWLILLVSVLTTAGAAGHPNGFSILSKFQPLHLGQGICAPNTKSEKLNEIRNEVPAGTRRSFPATVYPQSVQMNRAEQTSRRALPIESSFMRQFYRAQISTERLQQLNPTYQEVNA